MIKVEYTVEQAQLVANLLNNHKTMTESGATLANEALEVLKTAASTMEPEDTGEPTE